MKKLKLDNKVFGRLLVGLGLVGFLASVILVHESYALASNPDYVPSCSINPILACKSVITSGTGKLLFGIPNPVFGVGAFSALIAVGGMLWAGAEFKKWFWKLFHGVVLVGLATTVFFIYESLYVIGSLCIYCMITWATVLALLVYSTIYLKRQKLLSFPKTLSKAWPLLEKNSLGFLVLLYLFVFSLILFRFRDYFESVWF